MTGKVMFAIPTLEVNSVIVPINKQTNSMINTGGKYRSGTNVSPTFLAKPEAMLPLDIANPPPKRNIKLQGIFLWITSHVTKPSEDLTGLSPATKAKIMYR